MADVFERARTAGARRLKWNTLSFMTAARALYSRMGHEPDESVELGEGITLYTYRAEV